LPLLFNFSVECIIRTAQESQEGLKLNGTHQFLVCADDVKNWPKKINTMKKNIEALLDG
jgi:hypothetical protein